VTDDQFAELKQLLTEIRDALVAPEIVIDGCDHPEHRRVDFSTFSDPNHIICGVCRARLS
jgi:hypothetical protein